MPAPWVSFDEIKARVTIEQVLRRYGLLDSLQQKKGQWIGLCPLHEESTSSFKVTPDRNIWHCFGCQKGGDVIDLVRYFEGFTEGKRNADRRTAALLIAEWYGIASERPAPASGRKAGAATKTREARPVEEEREREEAHEAIVERRIEMPVNPPLKFELKNLDADHPYLRERGLTKKTICTFGLGFCSKGYLANRIAIPLHDSDGILIGYAGRWPGDEGWPEDESKYKMPSLEMGFSKKQILFNLHRAREYASEGLIVVEGFFSGVFALHQRGRYNVVAVMGSSMSAEQEKLIVDTALEQGGNKARVLLAFDDDEAGRRSMRDAAARLVPQVFVRTVELSI